MTVVFERPYEFVPPIRSTVWPWLVQRLRIYDRYLAKKEGVVDYELRETDLLKASLDAGHSVLLAPNHCRYADPLVMGWLARRLGIHVHAMASWHLFNEGWLDAFAIRRMGAFSIFREGNDRQSLETAIEILIDGARPLIVFPEGTTNRTNDQLKPLLDGVAFIARTAAKRRAKRFADDATRATAGSGKVVIHPIGIKYLCMDPVEPWANAQLDEFERRLGWHRMPPRDTRQRTVRLAEAMLSLKEIQYTGSTSQGDLPNRRDRLIETLLSSTEAEMGLHSSSSEVRERVRQIRSKVSALYFQSDQSPPIRDKMHRYVDAADFAQDLASYPDSYLIDGQATDTRIVETIQRMQESINGKANNSMRLKAVIEVAPAIEVDTARPPKGVRDPLMQTLDDELTKLINKLSSEAKPIGPSLQ
ncbi:1-acyl-sn-glycerol-3-phosphate acyltransferase [Stieleria sp. TO1_6]|uniref:lysophospholipid acyltransferase family protein n=1 Tax=Stieleria tagensis TaxID=2956795 RepID=UPI00209A9BCD|nr:1-acyl-sn-glycerol-3-phosphate acyltransferase [Stieleria tagensis]MCO8123788.1 1-acyl-sn-glycerol-3-phosphate acyltransferase [Stieleria tagensis]